MQISSMVVNETSAVISVNGEIDEDFITVLVSEFSKYGKMTSVTDITLILSSGGGSIGQVHKIADIFKPMGLKRVVGISCACSAAVYLGLICKSKGIEYYIDPLSYVMVHKIQFHPQEYHVNQMEQFCQNHAKKVDEGYFSYINEILKKMPTKLKRHYNNGSDVHIMGQDLIDYGVATEFTSLEDIIT
jgi:ATP-dependent protease ClpP protease subunit